MCTGVRCNTCALERTIRMVPQIDGDEVDCFHSSEDRHSDVPAIDRTPTPVMAANLKGSIRITMADGDSAACFLEFVARVMRTKKVFTITIEE